MRILLVSSFYLDEGTRFGGVKRLCYLLAELRRRHTVSVVCVDACEEHGQETGALERYGGFLYVPVRLHKTRIEDMLGIPVDVRRPLRTFHNAVSAFVQEASPEAVLLAFPHALSFLDIPSVVACRRIVYIEDDLLLEATRGAIGEAKGPARHLWRGMRYVRMLRYYRLRLRHVRRIIAISPEENEIWHRRFPRIPSTIVRYGIRIAEFPFLSTHPGNSAVGFIGNFRHLPNLDAVRWFVRRVLPLLLENLPQLRFVVCGKGMPPDLAAAMQSNSRIVDLGEVAALRTFYEQIDIFVNPIVSGRGLRCKLVEAAAFGRPLVSTPLGAEGLDDLQIETHEHAAGFLSGIIKLQQQPSYYDSVVKHNRHVVETVYSIHVQGRMLESAIEES
jgi:glycosyltransferase involved in cell wall biosynthesis